MKRYTLSTLSTEDCRRLCRRTVAFDPDTLAMAGEICSNVKRRGNAALAEYTARFDGVTVSQFRLPQQACDEALTSLEPTLRRALAFAAENIKRFHATQLRTEQPVETTPGVVCWREARPIETVGLYVPSGTAPLPSTVLMVGIPAVLAGCKRVVLCSPPRSNGTIDRLVLAAAATVGITEVYAVGGAQAIAALAYGTETVPQVDKIFGPGNKYVTAAKQIVSADPDGAAVDLLAGPSELLIIADDSADAHCVAADLVSQAEHDADARVALVTTSGSLADEVVDVLDVFSRELPRKSIIERALSESFTLVVETLDEAVEFANHYAPEHLILNTRSPEALVARIQSAGSVFLGSFSPVTAGDYASGTNHTLPTAATARRTSGLSVESFQKFITFQSLSERGLQRLAPTLLALAQVEGFDAHWKAVEVRTGPLQESP